MSGEAGYQRSPGTLACGVARREITPPPGVDLAGFIARAGPCTGVHDPLTATSLVATDGRSRVALVSCDLIGLGAALVRRLRAAVEQRVGIPAAHQMYACTHTHGGPETGVITSTGAADPSYLLWLEATLLDLVADAAGALAPARLGWQREDCVVAVNRRAPPGTPGPIDPDLLVAALQDRAGRPLATLVHYSCHPVAAGPDSREATADWWGVVRRQLEAAGSGPVLAINGAGGDINPPLIARGFAAVQAAGEAIGERALALWRRVGPVAASGTGAAQAHVPLAFLPLAEGQELAALGQERQRIEKQAAPESIAARAAAVTHGEHGRRLARLHWGSEPLPSVAAEVQALRLGPLIIAALPGEFFAGYGRLVKAAAPGLPVLVAGWTNDNLGYFPTREEYARGGYEVDLAYRYYGYPAAWSPDSAEAVANAAAGLVRRLAGDGKGAETWR